MTARHVHALVHPDPVIQPHQQPSGTENSEREDPGREEGNMLDHFASYNVTAPLDTTADMTSTDMPELVAPTLGNTVYLPLPDPPMVSAHLPQPARTYIPCPHMTTPMAPQHSLETPVYVPDLTPGPSPSTDFVYRTGRIPYVPGNDVTPPEDQDENNKPDTQPQGGQGGPQGEAGGAPH